MIIHVVCVVRGIQIFIYSELRAQLITIKIAQLQRKQDVSHMHIRRDLPLREE